MKCFSYMLLALFAFGIGACVGTDSRSQDSLKDSLLVSLEINMSTSAILTISNEGMETADFSLQLNNSFYSNKSKTAGFLLESARRLHVPPEEFAWYYVKDNYICTKPLSSKQWLHSSQLLLNSINFGQCDDLSFLLAELWKEMGFEARVWVLEGHVVPEVLIDGKWKMYDPSFQVYYEDDENEVLGVEDLEETPDLITKRSSRIDTGQSNLFAQTLKHFERISDLYSTTEDNVISEWYDLDTNYYDGSFTMPPNSMMYLPIIDSCKNCTGLFNQVKKMAVLTVPKDYTGTIEIPLVLSRLEGEANFKIGSKEVNLTDSVSKTYWIDYEEYNPELEIVSSSSELKLYYLINDKGLQIRPNNTIKVKGRNVNQLNITIDTLAQSQQTVIEPPPISELSQVILNDCECNEENKFNGMAFSKERLENYINSSCLSLGQSQKNELIHFFKDYMITLAEDLEDIESIQKLDSCWQYKLFLVYGGTLTHEQMQYLIENGELF